MDRDRDLMAVIGVVFSIFAIAFVGFIFLC
jgi:hypothetical protein